MTRVPARLPNIDHATVRGFGDEWSSFDQSELGGQEYAELFNRYFAIFPFDQLGADAEGFDLGCGSGRWAAAVAPRVGLLHCIDPAPKALAVARKHLSAHSNVRFHEGSADNNPLQPGSQDFGYSLGVLHHIPDTRRGLSDAVAKLKPGAPFLLYLYYAMDNRPAWFRAVWLASDAMRRGIARLPFTARKAITTLIAGAVYWPLARSARLAERFGANPQNIPLAPYRSCSFYTMRTDALDRLGTRLEQRFTRSEIQSMMHEVGLTDIRFSEREPFWVALGRKATT